MTGSQPLPSSLGGYSGKNSRRSWRFSKESCRKSSIKVIGGVYLGRGIVPGDAVRTRQRRSSPSGLLSAPQAAAAAPLPPTSPLRLRLNEFTLSSRSRKAVFFMGAQYRAVVSISL